jgi:hypothetical protein
LLGRGAVYRAVAILQRNYFTPPTDSRAAWDITHERHASKLTRGPPIEQGRDRRFTRHLRLARPKSDVKAV